MDVNTEDEHRSKRGDEKKSEYRCENCTVENATKDTMEGHTIIKHKATEDVKKKRMGGANVKKLENRGETNPKDLQKQKQIRSVTNATKAWKKKA